MKMRASLILSLTLTLLSIAGLIIFPAAGAAGARAGLSLCASVIIPSLFPFTVLACMLMDLRFPYGIGKIMRPVMGKAFRVSGAGSAAFFLGLAGGYPLGASAISEMYSSGQLEKKEAEKLLGFCDNSGPAFIIGVAGSVVFGSTAAGFFLYGIHILAAVITGLFMRGRGAYVETQVKAPPAAGFSVAFSQGVKRAAASCVTVCGFVVFFSVLMSLLDAVGFLPSLCGSLSVGLKLELHFTRSIVTGLLEVGTGVGSMLGLSFNALNTALAAFILGWGGLSVHAQATAVIKESGLSVGKHLAGKALHGIFSALIAYLAFPIFF